MTMFNYFQTCYKIFHILPTSWLAFFRTSHIVTEFMTDSMSNLFRPRRSLNALIGCYWHEVLT